MQMHKEGISACFIHLRLPALLLEGSARAKNLLRIADRETPQPVASHLRTFYVDLHAGSDVV